MNRIRDLFTQTIAFRPELVSITGSINAALILSQGIYWQDKVPPGRRPTGWWYKTQTEWSKETGLSKTAIETARKKLRTTVFWHEHRKGIPAKMWFTIDEEKLERVIKNFQSSGNLSPSSASSLQPEVPQTLGMVNQSPTARNLSTPLQDAYKPASTTETTTETTAKNTSPTTSEISSDTLTNPVGNREGGFNNNMLVYLGNES